MKVTGCYGCENLLVCPRHDRTAAEDYENADAFEGSERGRELVNAHNDGVRREMERLGRWVTSGAIPPFGPGEPPVSK